jgi:hypothetical protein
MCATCRSIVRQARSMSGMPTVVSINCTDIAIRAKRLTQLVRHCRDRLTQASQAVPDLRLVGAF